MSMYKCIVPGPSVLYGGVSTGVAAELDPDLGPLHPHRHLSLLETRGRCNKYIYIEYDITEQ